MQNIRLTFLGDVGVGKTCLLIRYARNSFPSGFIPQALDYCSVRIRMDCKAYSFQFIDIIRQEKYHLIRPIYYPSTDVFFLCFSLDDRSSFENIEYKWWPEVNHYRPDVPKIIVGCKQDLRDCPDPPLNTDLRECPGEEQNFVSHREGDALAKKLGCATYCETSAATGKGVNGCFEDAIRSVVTNTALQKKSKEAFSISGFFSKRDKKDDASPAPVMPLAAKAPKIEVEATTFAENWHEMQKNPKHTDVKFVFESKQELRSHKVILIGASKFFSKLLRTNDSVQENQLKMVMGDSSFSQQDLNQGLVAGVAGVYEEESQVSGRVDTVIELSGDIKGKIFAHILEFLYTGVPDFTDETTEEVLDNISNLARMFQLPDLETICVNKRNGEEFLNPSIGTFLNDKTGKQLKELFFNKQTLADIVFDVEGTQVYAHKVVLAARCEVMAAMLSGNFKEGTDSLSIIEMPGVSLDAFLTLLEYLYTDHTTLEEGDLVGIMILANQFCQTRLVNLCEHYITKEVHKSCQENIEKCDIDVIGLLLTSQVHNASQLEKWCLHFISINYTAFRQRLEFSQLSGSNLEYIEEHQWPPVSYLKEVEEYEKLKAKEKNVALCDVLARSCDLLVVTYVHS